MKYQVLQNQVLENECYYRQCDRNDWKSEQWGCCGSGGGANGTSNNNSKEAMKHICNCVEKEERQILW